MRTFLIGIIKVWPIFVPYKIKYPTLLDKGLRLVLKVQSEKQKNV